MAAKIQISLVGAHGGYASFQAPLGGGATIFECLINTWKHHDHLDLQILAPGPAYPELHPILRERSRPFNFSEIHPASLGYLDYAKFSRIFEQAATRFLIEKQAPQNSWVIANDLCEGPDILKLKNHGYKVITLVHVDVVDFMANMYLKRILPPNLLTKFWRTMDRVCFTSITPDIIKLIFEKQESAYRYSDFIVVPSEKMKATILKCYPELLASKVRVIPWGVPQMEPTIPLSSDKVSVWKTKWEIKADDFVILSLSRISPEKGIDRTLLALEKLEKQRPDLAKKCCFLIAGNAAYMDGPRYLKKLEKLASRLRLVRACFVGHLLGDAKKAAFSMAHLYSLMSFHESYGLTLSEALAEGVPAMVSESVAHAQESLQGIAFVGSLPKAIANFLALRMEEKNRDFKQPSPALFSKAADQMLALTGSPLSL
jgi:glycosyltransferase involved in cell wall biosynthesis